MQSAINEAVGSPVALNAGWPPVTGGPQSAEVESDSHKPKSVDLGAQSVLARAPEPAAGAPVTASPAQFTVGIPDGTSSTLTPVAASPSQSPDRSLDRATSPPPNGTPIVPGSSAAIQGLSATYAPKPATEREPEPPAPAQTTASSAQSPVATTDGTSSMPTAPVAGPLSHLLIAIWTEQPRRHQTERQSRRSLPRIRACRRPRLRSPQFPSAQSSTRQSRRQTRLEPHSRQNQRTNPRMGSRSLKATPGPTMPRAPAILRKTRRVNQCRDYTRPVFR